MLIFARRRFGATLVKIDAERAAIAAGTAVAKLAVRIAQAHNKIMIPNLGI